MTRKQREAQISALRREGIYLEEEYREEIERYMLEMEVRLILLPPQNAAKPLVFSNIRCVPPNPWTNNPKFDGICDLVSLISSWRFTSPSASDQKHSI